jgi:SAM-dependent methyltransferase
MKVTETTVNVDDGASEITPKDLRVSATAHDIQSLNEILKGIGLPRVYRMLDLGCGYGGLTKYVANNLKIPDVYGVDIDDGRLEQAKLKGIHTYNLDLNNARLPFPDGFFGLVTSFGALEHLAYFDNQLKESFRVLAKGGYLIVAMPNLASYINRIALLFGYQPRDVEISRKLSPGVLPFYPRGFLGHIHSATLLAVKQILNHYGFQVTKVKSSSPYQRNKLLKVVDKVFLPWPSLSRRFIILAKKN